MDLQSLVGVPKVLALEGLQEIDTENDIDIRNAKRKNGKELETVQTLQYA